MPSSAPDVQAEVDVGERLRALRRSRRATLRTVAERSGLSESFLSQVERGRSSASIESLRRGARALGGFLGHPLRPGALPGPPGLPGRGGPAPPLSALGQQGTLSPPPPPPPH